MKYLLLFLLPTITQASSIINLSADQTSYSAGTKAVLIATVVNPPTNPNYELVFDSRFDAKSARLVTVASDSAVAISPTLDAGESKWEVSVYLQNKLKAKSLEQGIVFYRDIEIPRLNSLLVKETDSARIAELEKEISRNFARVHELEEAALRNRAFLEVVDLPITVVSAIKRSTPLDNSGLISLSLNQPSFVIGDTATVSAHLNTRFAGRDDVVAIDLNGVSLKTTGSGADYAAAKLLTNTGLHTFTVSYLVRDTKQTERLRSALVSATATRGELLNDLQTATSPAERLYFQHKIDDIDFAMEGIKAQMTAILDLVATNSISFEVQ